MIIKIEKIKPFIENINVDRYEATLKINNCDIRGVMIYSNNGYFYTVAVYHEDVIVMTERIGPEYADITLAIRKFKEEMEVVSRKVNLMDFRNDSRNPIGALLILWCLLAAWLTHLIVCFNDDKWGFLVAGAIFFPIAILHGFSVRV